MKTLSLAHLALAVAFAAAPLVTPPFTGFTADQLPIPQINPPVEPAGYAFAIWGVIYLGLIGSALFGVLKRAEAEDWARGRVPLIVSLAIGVPWLAIAGQSAIWATVTIFLMAAGAIAALLAGPQRDLWSFRVPVGLYAGWLTAASFVSLGSTAAGFGLVFGPLGWAVAGILGALSVAAAVLSAGAGPGYGAAVVWALVGIVVANLNTAPGIASLAAGGAVAAALLTWRMGRRARRAAGHRAAA